MSFAKKLSKEYEDFLRLRESLGYAKEVLPNSLTAFIAFCGNFYPDANHLTKDMLDTWLAQKDFQTKSSHGRFISRLRTFTKYQATVGETTFIPSEDYSVSRPAHPYNRPYIFNDEEMRRLFDAIDTLQPCRESPERHYVIPVIFRMMYCCGMRPQEPMSLLCEDVDLSTGEIIIRQSKAHKDRRILMSTDLMELCKKYDELMNPRIYFFETPAGLPYDVGWVRRQLKICWRNAGYEERGNIRPYDLRHNFAARIIMRWVDEGIDIASMISYLSAYMGHSNFSDTLYYIHLLPETLVKSSGIDWKRFKYIYPEVSNE